MKKSPNDKEKPALRPAFTVEERENRLIALAMDRAEERLKDGTASNQMICHFLKLGSSRERLDQQNIEEEINLKIAKREAINSAKEIEILYTDAMKAMQRYHGHRVDEEDVS